MLKRLSATLNGPQSSSSSSTSPSSQHAPLPRSYSSASVSYDQAQQQAYAQSPFTYDQSAYARRTSLSLDQQQPYAGQQSTSNNTQAMAHSYPRPSGLSTPAFDINMQQQQQQQQVNGYFNLQLPHSSAGQPTRSIDGGTASGRTSAAPSPAHSPRITGASLPFQHSSNSNTGSASNPGSRTPSLSNAPLSTSPHQGHGQAVHVPIQPSLSPIDRPTLQKSLRALETLLVALDEYRELNSRMAKVEKRLAKGVRDLAGSLLAGSKEEQQRDAGAFYSVVQTLNTTASLFDSLQDVESKFSRLLSKEYDNINETCGRSFKKIAKDERQYDDLAESLDSKLKKANYAYDKRVRASAPGSGTAQAAHEQYVPLLAQLTDDLSRSKHSHALNMASKREGVVRDFARAMASLADAEFRKACEGVRRLGVDVGPVLALQALLGPPSSNSNGGNGKSANGPGTPMMPSYWPADLPETDEFGRLQPQLQPQLPLQQQHLQQGRTSSNSPVMTSPNMSDCTDSQGTRGAGSSISMASRSSSSATSELLPPRPAFANTRTESSVRSADGGTQQMRSASMSYLDGQAQGHVDKYGNVGLNSHAHTPEVQQLPPQQQQRSVSFPVDVRQAPPMSVQMDHDKTVTMRNVQSKPQLDTSFFPAASSSSTFGAPVPKSSAASDNSGQGRDGSPTLRDSPSAARTPALRTAMNYSPSQSAKIGYFGPTSPPGTNARHGQLEGVMEDEREEHQDSQLTRKVVRGFDIDERPERSYRGAEREDPPLRDVRPGIPESSSYTSIIEHAEAPSHGSSSTSSEARRDETRNGNQAQSETGAQLERSLSNASTASEKSFVARMKELYAEEREARKRAKDQQQQQSAASAGRAGNNVDSSLARPSSRRVSTIAQQWEEKSLRSGTPPPENSTRPHHHHRASMPVMPSSHTSSSSLNGRGERAYH